MAARSDVRIESHGVTEAVQSLLRAGEDIQDLSTLMGRIGQSLKAAVDVPRRTGRLASSLRETQDKERTTIQAGGPAVQYAGVINFGWPVHHIKPQPFLTSAGYAKEPTVLRTLEQGIEDILRRNDLR